MNITYRNITNIVGNFQSGFLNGESTLDIEYLSSMANVTQW